MYWVSEDTRESIKVLFNITGVTNLVHSIAGSIMMQLDVVEKIPYLPISTIAGVVWVIVNSYIKLKDMVTSKREREQKMKLDKERHDHEMLERTIELDRQQREIKKLDEEIRDLNIKRMMGSLSIQLDKDLYEKASYSENKHIEQMQELLEKQKQRNRVILKDRL
jgi:predicted membrane protein